MRLVAVDALGCGWCAWLRACLCQFLMLFPGADFSSEI